jgi:hypothetical protein
VTEAEETKLLTEDRRAILDAIFQLTKWVIGTLFLLNGAAALAAVNSTTLNHLIGSAIALFFVNGVMASIVAAVGFVTALLSSYIRVAHLLKPYGQWIFPAILIAQLIGATMTLYGIGSSVDAFTSGVKLWANVSIQEAKRQQALAKAATQQTERARQVPARVTSAKHSAPNSKNE